MTFPLPVQYNLFIYVGGLSCGFVMFKQKMSPLWTISGVRFGHRKYIKEKYRRLSSSNYNDMQFKYQCTGHLGAYVTWCLKGLMDGWIVTR